MSAPQFNFYTTGGTIPPDSNAYVERLADTEIIQCLLRAEYCYVLDSRQMGKSSLMVRTAMKLRASDYRVAILDLTSIGQNLSAEQWYGGLAVEMGRQLGCEDEIEELWFENSQYGPLQRWFEVIEVIVRQIAKEAKIVVFVDEIDAVRSIRSFATDEFFAGIRALYNRRSENPEYSRITFCLLGVATPAELVTDPNSTPFNIGQRIVLEDFTQDESKMLANGLDCSKEHAHKIIKRIHYWTSGHPYLTQRLCSAVAGLHESADLKSVDQECNRLFLGKEASEIDDNLAFVRNRIIRGSSDVIASLDLYRQVLQNRRIPDDEFDLTISDLKLSGIVRDQNGQIAVRNRIYRRVFDANWVDANLPGAELARQKQAFRRGILRASTIFGVVFAVMLFLLFMVVRAQQRAQLAMLSEESARNLSDAMGYSANVQLAMALINSASGENKEGNLNDALAALKSCDPTRPGMLDRRSFDWRYAFRLCKAQNFTTTLAKLAVKLDLSPDGSLLAVSGPIHGVDFVDAHTGIPSEVHIEGSPGMIIDVKFLSNDRIAVSSLAGGVTLLRRKGDTYGVERSIVDASAMRLAVSPSGSFLAALSKDGDVSIIDSREMRLVSRWKVGQNSMGLAWHGDDELALSYIGESGVLVANIFSRTGIRKLVRPLQISGFPIVQYVAGGALMTPGGRNSALFIWPPPYDKPIEMFGQEAEAIAFSATKDGLRAATGDRNGTIYLWDIPSRKLLRKLKVGEKPITDIVFAHDGNSVYVLSAQSLKSFVFKRAEPYKSFGNLRAAQIEIAADSPRYIACDYGISKLTAMVIGDYLTGTIISTDWIPAESTIAISPNGTQYAVRTNESIVEIRNSVNNKVALRFSITKSAGGGGIGFVSSNSVFVFDRSRTSIDIYAVSTGKLIKTIDLPGGLLVRARAIANPSAIVYCTADGEVGIFDLDTNHNRWLRKLHLAHPNDMSIAAGGDLGVSCTTDGVIVWRIRDGLVVNKWAIPNGVPVSCGINRSGRTIAIGLRDGSAKLWDVAASRATVELLAKSTEAEQMLSIGGSIVRFAPNDEQLIAAKLPYGLLGFSAPLLSKQNDEIP